jgi:hypothetical protein
MLVPYRTLADPETQGEGSIDPLGLATLADRLADWMLPGMTARMWRPRFLTAMAVTALIVEPCADELAADGVTPPWLVLEWLCVEALAGVREGTENLRRVPGIDKARRALSDGVPMNADRYLKTPKVFGFHGIYKRLARHVDVVDDDLALGENGYRLLRVWEADQQLSGFADRELLEGEPARLRKVIREAVRAGLDAGQTTRRASWPGAELFVRHLTPHAVGRKESELLWQLLVDSAATTRGETFRLMRESTIREAFREHGSERKIGQALQRQGSSDLRRRLTAIESYEAFCRPIQEAWDRLRLLATVRRPSLVRPTDIVPDERVREIAGGCRPAIEQARDALAESPIEVDFERLPRRFGDVRTGADLFAVLWEHHQEVQRGKPPEGKRPWFEETADGGLVVRPAYRLDEAPVREEYVHPYRIASVAAFIDDLDGAA